MAEIPFPCWDPVLVHIGGFGIRWYGLMYVVGFFVGQHILVRLARARFLPLPESRIPDLIVWLVLGVLLGGRLGYCIFYKPELLTHPLQLVAVWEGGLSFHGGLLGVVVVFVLFARRTRVPAWRLADALALGVTPGIFAVRLANFINGELYGRITDSSVPWAMRFPTDPKALELLGLTGVESLREREARVLEACRDGTWARIRDQVPLRHPSQIYEALWEGLLLGLVLFLVYRRTRGRPLGSGVYGGIFVLGYGVGRWVLEFFREPDAHLGTVLGPFSMGQVLCTAMIVAGIAIVVLRSRARDPGEGAAGGGGAT